MSQDGRWAVGRDMRGYISDYKRPAADIYRVNTSTGERTLILKNQLIGQHVLGISPDGNYFLYWKDNKFQAYNLDAATTKTLGGGSQRQLRRRASSTIRDRSRRTASPATRATARRSIAQHQYDLWARAARRIGADEPHERRGRARARCASATSRSSRIRTAPAAPGGGGGGGGRGGRGGAEARSISSKPVTLSAYGEWTKKAGFYELADGQMKELVYEDASFSQSDEGGEGRRLPLHAADVHRVPRPARVGPGLQGLEEDQRRESAAVRVSVGPSHPVRLQGPRRPPAAGHSRDSRRLQAGREAADARELLREELAEPESLLGAVVSSPAWARSPIEAMSRGYVTMMPDVYFHTGSSHSDMLDAVEAATKKVIEMGYVDPKKIGINGHSYGGEGAAFIGTRSRLFAAVGMGAGVTDLYQDFSQNWGWAYQVPGGSGANGNDYYLYGQGRWGFSPWDKPDVYMFESALTHVPEVTAPFLIMHGTADPTVAFQNGLGFYNALRYNGKNAVLLAYTGEGHGLRGLANRKDLTIRYFQFFDHYLKGAPAPKWMTDGVPFLQKDAAKAEGQSIVP